MDDNFLEYRAQWILKGFPSREISNLKWSKELLIKQLDRVQKIAKHYYFSSYTRMKSDEELEKVNVIAPHIIETYWKSIKIM